MNRANQLPDQGPDPWHGAMALLWHGAMAPGCHVARYLFMTVNLPPCSGPLIYLAELVKHSIASPRPLCIHAFSKNIIKSNGTMLNAGIIYTKWNVIKSNGTMPNAGIIYTKWNVKTTVTNTNNKTCELLIYT